MRITDILIFMVMRIGKFIGEKRRGGKDKGRKKAELLRFRPQELQHLKDTEKMNSEQSKL